MSTRTEPDGNFILAKKKQQQQQNKNQNQTKQKNSSGPLLVPRSAILLESIRGSGQKDRTYCSYVQTPPSLQKKSRKEAGFFCGEGGDCILLDRSRSFFTVG